MEHFSYSTCEDRSLWEYNHWHLTSTAHRIHTHTNWNMQKDTRMITELQTIPWWFNSSTKSGKSVVCTRKLQTNGKTEWTVHIEPKRQTFIVNVKRLLYIYLTHLCLFVVRIRWQLHVKSWNAIIFKVYFWIEFRTKIAWP